MSVVKRYFTGIKVQEYFLRKLGYDRILYALTLNIGYAMGVDNAGKSLMNLAIAVMDSVRKVLLLYAHRFSPGKLAEFSRSIILFNNNADKDNHKDNKKPIVWIDINAGVAMGSLVCRRYVA